MCARFKVLQAALVFCCFTAVQCVVYPTFHWIKFNEAFKRNTTLFVQPWSQIMFQCPNPATVLTEQSFTHSAYRLFENMWLVDKHGYDTCTVNLSKKTHKKLMTCLTPTKLVYYTITFQQFTATKMQLKYKRGETYYLISTSKGSMRSVKHKAGGHCKTHNMRLKIYVCKHKQDPKCVNNFWRTC